MATEDNEDENWVQGQRLQVLVYLKENLAEFRSLGECPAWDVCPYFAIWAVESVANPGSVGFWVFSGDVPTDVIKRDWKRADDNPRSALARLIQAWSAYLTNLEAGKNPPGISFGNSDEGRRDMAELLQRRISLLVDWRDDQSIWPPGCSL